MISIFFGPYIPYNVQNLAFILNFHSFPCKIGRMSSFL